HLRRDVVRTIGRVQERLRARGDLAAPVQDDLAQLLAQVRAAGLAGGEDRTALLLQPLHEARRLGRLARPVAALERDEQALVTGARHQDFFAAFFAGARRVVFLAGPRARRSASNCTARAK